MLRKAYGTYMSFLCGLRVQPQLICGYEQTRLNAVSAIFDGDSTGVKFSDLLHKTQS